MGGASCAAQGHRKENQESMFDVTKEYIDEKGNPQRLCFWEAGKVDRLQTEDPKIAARIRRWSFIGKPVCTGWNCYFYVWETPRKKRKKIMRALGLSTTVAPKKHQDAECSPDIGGQPEFCMQNSRGSDSNSARQTG